MKIQPSTQLFRDLPPFCLSYTSPVPSCTVAYATAAGGGRVCSIYRHTPRVLHTASALLCPLLLLPLLRLFLLPPFSAAMPCVNIPSLRATYFTLCLSLERATTTHAPAVTAVAAAAPPELLQKTAARALLARRCVGSCACLPSHHLQTVLLKCLPPLQHWQQRKQQQYRLHQQQQPQAPKPQWQQSLPKAREAAVCRGTAVARIARGCRCSPSPFSPFPFFRQRCPTVRSISSCCAFPGLRASPGFTAASFCDQPLLQRPRTVQPSCQSLSLEHAEVLQRQQQQRQQRKLPQQQQQEQRHALFLLGTTLNRGSLGWATCRGSRGSGAVAVVAPPQRKAPAVAVVASPAGTAFSPEGAVAARARAATAARLEVTAAAFIIGRTYVTHNNRVQALPNSSTSPQQHQHQQQRQRQQQQSQSHEKIGKSSAMEKRTQALVPYDPDNVFKKIIAGQIPCHKIFETEHVLAILDAFPAVAGHSLLIQKKEVSSIFDMDEETAAAVFRELPRLCRAVQKATNCDGINVLQNNGKAAGQVVFHAHVHVVPRFENDRLFRQFAGSKEMISSAAAKEMVDKIRSHL